MKISPTDQRILTALAVLACFAPPLRGAEVRGTVGISYQGLYQPDQTSQAHPVSVALLPAAGQRYLRRGPQTTRIEIVGNRMQPPFLTVQKGDSVEFINRDHVYHELFSLAPGNPVKARLGKAGDRRHDHKRFTLSGEGTVHFFCRIHNKSYARIDVVATPYIRMIEPGGDFEFSALPAGDWRLRLASPAAETLWYPVSAVTAPPPVQVTLKSHRGGAHSGADRAGDIDRLYRAGAAQGVAP